MPLAIRIVVSPMTSETARYKPDLNQNKANKSEQTSTAPGRELATKKGVGGEIECMYGGEGQWGGARYSEKVREWLSRALTRKQVLAQEWGRGPGRW